MFVVTKGPHLRQLRQVVGTSETVCFDQHYKIELRVNALCSVRGLDLPVDIPYKVNANDSLWLVTGSLTGHGLEDYDPTVMALLAFDQRGKLTSGVVVIVSWSENDSAGASTEIVMSGVLAKMLAQSVKTWPYYPDKDR